MPAECARGQRLLFKDDASAQLKIAEVIESVTQGVVHIMKADKKKLSVADVSVLFSWKRVSFSQNSQESPSIFAQTSQDSPPLEPSELLRESQAQNRGDAEDTHCQKCGKNVVGLFSLRGIKPPKKHDCVPPALECRPHTDGHQSCCLRRVIEIENGFVMLR